MKGITIFLVVSLVAALGHQDGGDDGTQTISPSPTSIWVTTTVNGALTTIQVEFTQSFQATPTVAATVPLGSAGLASHSGGVGTTREYEKTTVNGAAALAVGAAGVAMMAVLL